MRIVGPTRDNMPMKMGYGISQASKIDLGGRCQIANRIFDRKYDLHQAVPFGIGQIGHFLYVPIEYHSAKPRVIVICNQHHPGEFASPQQVPTGRVAQFTFDNC